MQVSANLSASGFYASYTISHLEKNSTPNGARYQEAMRTQSFSYTYVSFELQLGVAETDFQKDYEAFQSFLEKIGYQGKAIAELDREEAEALVAEDGFFGIAKTAERIADFVLEGARGEESLLRAGREGILRGFKEAERLWGGKLPEISYKTIDKAVKMIDMAMHDLGFAILSEEA